MRDKNQVQREIIDILKTKNIKGIVLASVRSGKCRQILTAIKEHTLINNPKIFLSYPNTDIKNSWIRECELINFFPEFIFSTFIVPRLSFSKIVLQIYKPNPEPFFVVLVEKYGLKIFIIIVTWIIKKYLIK